MSENCADNNKTRWRGENGGQGERQVAKWQVAMTAAVAAESADRNWTQAECDIINGGICKRRKAPKKLAKIYPIYICKGGYIAKRINTHNYGTRKGGGRRKEAQKDCENKWKMSFQCRFDFLLVSFTFWLHFNCNLMLQQQQRLQRRLRSQLQQQQLLLLLLLLLLHACSEDSFALQFFLIIFCSFFFLLCFHFFSSVCLLMAFSPPALLLLSLLLLFFRSRIFRIFRFSDILF